MIMNEIASSAGIEDWLGIEDVEDSRKIVEPFRFSPQLVRYLQEDPKRMYALSPEEFEQFVAERFDRMGYHVKRTGRSNRKDGGVDIVAVPKNAVPGSVLVAAQVKHHREGRKSDSADVRDLAAWRGQEFGSGVLVTNTQFTADAIWEAQKGRGRHFVKLRDEKAIKRWLVDNFADIEETQDLPDSIELANGVRVDLSDLLRKSKK